MRWSNAGLARRTIRWCAGSLREAYSSQAAGAVGPSGVILRPTASVSSHPFSALRSVAEAHMADIYPRSLGFKARRAALGVSATHTPDQARIPAYLQAHYWWAYIHPYGVQFFERQWLINLILWGNYGRLRDAALNQLGPSFDGATLQVACAYGDLSVRLAERVPKDGGNLDIGDV